MHDWKRTRCQVAALSQQLRSEVVSYSGVSWNCVYVCACMLMCMGRYIQRPEVNVQCLPQSLPILFGLQIHLSADWFAQRYASIMISQSSQDIVQN